MEEDDGPMVTMKEFLEDQEAEEERMDMVLGADDGDECTYKKGYVRRQAIFSCLTCAPSGNAGVCTACALKCHDGHEVLELWTKRNLRCDCGNSKFAGNECKLWKEKEPENEKNTYNKNFLGLYCSCDTRDEVSMLQCCICEDWFHEDHLGFDKVPKPEDYSDLICPGCTSRCSFVFRYPELVVSPVDGDDNAAKEPAKGSEAEVKDGECSVGDDNVGKQPATNTDAGAEQAKTEVKDPEKNKSAVAVNGDVAGSSQAVVCKLKDRDVSQTAFSPDKAVFMIWEWRKDICHCSACVDDYKSRGLEFLMDEMDTIQNYEALAKEKRKSNMEQAEASVADMINKLDHVNKLEFLYGVNDFTSKLKNFLTGFGDSGKTMTSGDVQEFFEKLHKKRRTG